MDTRRKRLFHQSHYRGTKELDIVLGRFADKHLATLSEQEVDAYEALLEVQETVLYDWLTLRDTPTPEHQTSLWDKIMDSLP